MRSAVSKFKLHQVTALVMSTALAVQTVTLGREATLNSFGCNSTLGLETAVSRCIRNRPE